MTKQEYIQKTTIALMHGYVSGNTDALNYIARNYSFCQDNIIQAAKNMADKLYGKDEMIID